MTATTGVVITERYGVTRTRKPVKFALNAKTQKPALSLRPGENLYTLHPNGEGSHLFWYQGKAYNDMIEFPDEIAGNPPDGTEFVSRPRYVWWAKIKTPSGKVGWTNQTSRFDNKDACG